MKQKQNKTKYQQIQTKVELKEETMTKKAKAPSFFLNIKNQEMKAI